MDDLDGGMTDEDIEFHIKKNVAKNIIALDGGPNTEEIETALFGSIQRNLKEYLDRRMLLRFTLSTHARREGEKKPLVDIDNLTVVVAYQDREDMHRFISLNVEQSYAFLEDSIPPWLKSEESEVSPEVPVDEEYKAFFENGIMVDETTIEAKLFNIIDDIDTAIDVYKPEMQGFEKYCVTKVEAAHDLICSDGYKLFYTGDSFKSTKTVYTMLLNEHKMLTAHSARITHFLIQEGAPENATNAYLLRKQKALLEDYLKNLLRCIANYECEED